MNKKIELSPRLRMVAGLVPPGSRLADIGTDHAYLPAALIQEGTIPTAIAADLRQGPLNRAKATVRECGLTGRVTFRLCSGLEGVRPDEVDAVAIAGMGGETIADILAAAPWTRERDVPLVLQPMSSMDDLRLWLERHGYIIVKEELAREGETLYTALLVRSGAMVPMTAAERLAGKNTDHPLRGAWLDRWLDKTDRALTGLARAQKPEAAARLEELKQLQTELSEMKKEWEAWQR